MTPRDELRELLYAHIDDDVTGAVGGLNGMEKWAPDEIRDLVRHAILVVTDQVPDDRMPSLPVDGGDGRAAELLWQVGMSADGWSSGLDPDLRDEIDEWWEAAACPRCKGRGARNAGPERIICAVCRGTRRRPPVSSSAGDEAREALERVLSNAAAMEAAAKAIDAYVPFTAGNLLHMASAFADAARAAVAALPSPLQGAGDGAKVYRVVDKRGKPMTRAVAERDDPLLRLARWDDFAPAQAPHRLEEADAPRELTWTAAAPLSGVEQTEETTR